MGCRLEAEEEEVGGRSRAKVTPQGSSTPSSPAPLWPPTPALESLVLCSQPPPPQVSALPHFPLPPGSARSKLPGALATVLCFLEEPEPLTRNSRQKADGLAPSGSWEPGLWSGLVQHLLPSVPGNIHISDPPRALAKACFSFVGKHYFMTSKPRCEARKVNSSMFRTDLIHLASIVGWLQYLFVCIYLTSARTAGLDQGTLMRLEGKVKGRF